MSGTLLATVVLMRATVTVIFFAALGVVGACSSTTMDEGCYRDSDCAAGDLCDDSVGACYSPTDGGNDVCSAPEDCPSSYTCGKDGRCMPGDCYFNGCVTGFECQSSTGTWKCSSSSGGAAGASGDLSDAGAAGVAGAGQPG